MVNLLFIEDDDLLTKPGIVKSLLDPLRDRRHGVGGREPPTGPEPRRKAREFGQELNVPLGFGETSIALHRRTSQCTQRRDCSLRAIRGPSRCPRRSD